MKKEKILYLVLIIFSSLIILTPIKSPAQDLDNENLGRVRGWIVDPSTGKYVKERFNVYFYFSENYFEIGPKIRALTTTNSDGYFEIYLEPNSYFVRIEPEFSTKRYCTEPDISEHEKHKYMLQVKRGKIHEMKKTATIGGHIEIKIVDFNGDVVNLKERFPHINEKPRVFLSAPNGSARGGVYGNDSADDLFDGVILSKPVCPGIYSARLEIEGLGYFNFKVNNILIETGRTSIANFKIDPGDNTGIEGIVVDKDGKAIPYASIILSNRDGDYVAFCSSNSKGYYRILAVKPDEYNLSVTTDNIFWESDYFNITKGTTFKKIVQLDEY